MSGDIGKRTQSSRIRIKREHFQRWRESSDVTLRVTKEKFRSHWREFCSVAPIHGMRYLGEPKRPLVEKYEGLRIWWLVVVFVSMAYAGKSSWQQYQKLIKSPISEVPEENYGNLTIIPFPAVTICDNRKSYFHDENTEVETKRLFREAKLFICGDPHPLSEETDMRKMIMMSPPLDQSCDLSNAFLKKTWTNCTSMFRRIVTDVGVCHTFNMFSPVEIFTEGTEIEYEKHNKSSDWMPEETAYAGNAPRVNNNPEAAFSPPYPKRAENQLTLTLFNQLLSKALEILYCESSDRLGFQIILHNPHEVPMVGHRRNIWSPTEFNESSIGQYFSLPMERKLQLIVEPKLIKANEELKQFPAEHRNCYFPGEKELFFFRHYSYSNCQLECVANLTLTECLCADYYMPRVKETKLCDRSHLGCIMSVLEDWKRRGGRNCNCLNSCNLIEYHAKAWYTYSPDEGEIEWNDTSLSVVMGDKVFLITERKPMYTKIDFFANCGGLFGLFCGMSLLSVVEIVYHGSFRVLATLFYNWRHKNKK